MSFRANFTSEEQESIIASAMARLKLSREQAERILDARDRPVKRKALLEQQWVHNLHVVCEAFRLGKAEPDGLFALAFWIGLYGVLAELREGFRGASETAQLLSKMGKSHSYFSACAEVFDACEEIRGCLSEDEIIFITFVRQIHAHVYQEGFEYGLQPGTTTRAGTIRDTQTVRLLGRSVPVDEAHRVLDEISAKNGHDETRVVTNFAHKVGPSVERLESAMTRVTLEREKDNQLSEQWRRARGAG
jgi:hypothetical protein